MSIESWLKNFIFAEEASRRVVKCIKMTEEPLTAKNKNYMSDISRLGMSVELGSGALSEVSFVAKRVPDSQSIKEMYADFKITEQETMTYENLAKIDQLMKDHKDVRENLWAQFIGCCDSVLVFEDLTAKGYKPYSQANWLNEEHSKVVLRELARYHAMGAKAVDTKLVDSKTFNPLYCFNKRCQENIFLPGVKSLRDAVLSWGSEWSESVSQLTQIVDHFDEIMQKLNQVDQKTLSVIAHGDCWRGNMLFKHDVDGRVLSMKFVDFQTTSHCTFAFDLIVFLISSVEHELRWAKLDGLLEVYRKSLVDNMKFYELDSSRAPSLVELNEILEFLQPVVIIMLTMYWPVTSDEVEVKVSDQYDKDSTFLTPEMFSSESCKLILGTELKMMHGKNILQENFY